MTKSKRNIIKSALNSWMNEHRNITIHTIFDLFIDYDELTIPTLELLNENKNYLNEFIFYLKNTKADEMRQFLCIYLEPYVERY